jgi:hypothetical protein
MALFLGGIYQLANILQRLGFVVKGSMYASKKFLSERQETGLFFDDMFIQKGLE